MTWKISELTPETSIIVRDPEILVGSIARIDDRWMVEIMWGGPTGDIQGEFDSLPRALAFIEGVEKALVAFEAART